MQWSTAVQTLGIHISASFQQYLNHIFETAESGMVQGSETIIVAVVYIDSKME